MVVRAIEELVSVEDAGWPEVESLVGASAEGQVLLGDSDRSRDVLFALQVTSRSFLGAMALNCGGVVADHGWFRLLGGAGSSLMDLASANSLSVPASDSGPPPWLIVGFDALGGRFAVDGEGPAKERLNFASVPSERNEHDRAKVRTAGRRRRPCSSSWAGAG